MESSRVTTALPSTEPVHEGSAKVEGCHVTKRKKEARQPRVSFSGQVHPPGSVRPPRSEMPEQASPVCLLLCDASPAPMSQLTPHVVWAVPPGLQS